MRFSVKRRLFSLLAGSWLVLLLAEPAKLHVCAVHTDGMVHAAMHHSDAHTTTASHRTSGGHEHSAKCTCLGASSYANAVVIPKVEETSFADGPVAVVADLPATAEATPPSPSPFFLPYPNGPPIAIAS